MTVEPFENALPIGEDVLISYTSLKPDRELNPQFEGIPDIDRLGLIIWHRTAAGEWCHSGIYFNLPGVERILPSRSMWDVISMDPLHIEPSVMCVACGFHGWIREGRWVPA